MCWRTWLLNPPNVQCALLTLLKDAHAARMSGIVEGELYSVTHNIIIIFPPYAVGYQLTCTNFSTVGDLGRRREGNASPFGSILWCWITKIFLVYPSFCLHQLFLEELIVFARLSWRVIWPYHCSFLCFTTCKSHSCFPLSSSIFCHTLIYILSNSYHSDFSYYYCSSCYNRLHFILYLMFMIFFYCFNK